MNILLKKGELFVLTLEGQSIYTIVGSGWTQSSEFYSLVSAGDSDYFNMEQTSVSSVSGDTTTTIYTYTLNLKKPVTPGTYEIYIKTYISSGTYDGVNPPVYNSSDLEVKYTIEVYEPIYNYSYVLNILKEIGEKVINEVFIGDAYEVENEARKYPLMVIDPHIKEHNYMNGVLRLNIDLYLVDITKDDLSDELNIISSMSNILLDFINYLRDKDETYGFYIKKDYGDVITFRTFTEKWTDQVAGVKGNISIEIKNDGNNCKNIFELNE